MHSLYRRLICRQKRLLQICLLLAILLSAAFLSPSFADDIFVHRPAFSMAEQPAAKWARCDEIRRMSDGLDMPEFRIDLSVMGELGLVTTDGALWYLGVCGGPDQVKVLCVTYNPNGMKAGDTVYLKGGYKRAGPNHILLDPCLADRPDQPNDIEPK